jgi:hypothetical protein
MGTWVKANGGPLAVVVLGAGILGFQNTWIGVILIVVGVVSYLLTALRAPDEEPHADVPAPPVAAPDIVILEEIVPTGGGGDSVSFRVEVVNYGSRQTRVRFAARVDDVPVECDPARLDMIPGHPPERVRIDVPRPTLGHLVREFGTENATTVYGRSLTFEALWEEGVISKTWSEHVYTNDDNPIRAGIQAREWRIGRGEETGADRRADAISESHERFRQDRRRG